MSVRSDKSKKDATPDAAAVLAKTVETEAPLAEGNAYCVASPDNPLRRNLVVSIRASLNDLCLSKSKATWAPSTEALKSIFQQKRFTSLEGAAETQGDLKVPVIQYSCICSMLCFGQHTLSPVCLFLRSLSSCTCLLYTSPSPRDS